MVYEAIRWDDLETELSRTFQPATPISEQRFFRGRRGPMRRVIDAVNQSGQHVIVYGERGVGKTSLANVLTDYLRPLSSESIASVKINCFRETTFDSIWQAIFSELAISTDEVGLTVTPSDVVSALQRERKLILIVDEFDRIEDPDVDAMFADTIKALSDFDVDTTLVILGVADDVDDLIYEHESIDRCLLQLHLPRMPFEELKDIVTLGFEAVGMQIGEDAASDICTVSLGLPHYTHALSLNSGRAAIDRSNAGVDSRDVQRAIDLLTRESQQTMIRKFDTATASPRRENFFFQVLLACALAETDHLGYFRAANVREPYSQIMGRRYDIPSFVRHLHDLAHEKRGEVLQRLGERHNYRFRFADPMLQPYVLMHGLKRGLVGLADIAPPNGE